MTQDDVHNPLSDEDFLNTISSRLTDKEKCVKETLERAKSVYVPCGRDRVAKMIVSHFVTMMLAKRAGRRDDGRVLFVTGESGAGKTTLVDRLLSETTALAPVQTSYGIINPVISLTLMGPSTLKFLGLNMLQQAGYKITRKYEQGEVWDILPEQLHLRKVLVVHLDETQHILKLTESDRERDAVRKALKGVMNYKPWPVSFFMSGLPGITSLAKLDEQIERRARHLALPDVQLPEERVLILKIIRAMCEAAGLEANNVLESDLPERIAHAARYRYGRIAQVILAAIEQAAYRSSSALTRDHFAYAYIEHSQARGHDEMNPFLVDEWERLDPGLFMIEDD
ncbi:ATP-binding protein [Pseudaminobacter sp. 19-2017]|uniref:ATP-binding protein n=1 Tax=Pseudaminobacter soli (ex Zhang et al. 2022) TaxID=2831468 RepID=A0A942E7Y0_9HYPH|nr:ATP-binding protein [Pseudaminobacter soli]MBS3652080.1 ATP-binding protein [Pseudaminobacter soli]